MSVSFLQIYLEHVQDLFSTDDLQPTPQKKGGGRGSSSSSAKPAITNLPVREDPKQGFYVEGLQEFEVRDFQEAIEMLNWGLENRKIGATRMNATSSRSHTMLTVKVRQVTAATDGVTRTLEGKLIMVDLAGSERVRKTISKYVPPGCEGWEGQGVGRRHWQVLRRAERGMAMAPVPGRHELIPCLRYGTDPVTTVWY